MREQQISSWVANISQLFLDFRFNVGILLGNDTSRFALVPARAIEFTRILHHVNTVVHKIVQRARVSSPTSSKQSLSSPTHFPSLPMLQVAQIPESPGSMLLA